MNPKLILPVILLVGGAAGAGYYLGTRASTSAGPAAAGHPSAQAKSTARLPPPPSTPSPLRRLDLSRKPPQAEVIPLIEHAASRSPLPRPIDPNEVANAAVFLCSPLASAITGQILYVDCGYNVMGV